MLPRDLGDRVGLAGAEEAELDAHPVFLRPAHSTRKLDVGFATGKARVDDDIAVERRRCVGRDEHPADRDVERGPGASLIVPLLSEGHGQLDGDAGKATLFVHPAMVPSRASVGMRKASSKLRGGRLFALVPVLVGGVLFALAVPRAVPPSEVPLPAIDTRALARVEADDDARVANAKRSPLDSPLLGLGSAVRDLLSSQTRGVSAERLSDLRRTIDQRRAVAAASSGVPGLLALRAVQSERFRRAVDDWRSNHVESDELHATGGNFVARMESVGWIEDGRLLLEESELRVAYKLLWNAVVGVDIEPAFAVSLDEERALAAFSIAHPHASESDRRRLADLRRRTTGAADLARIDEEEATLRERWRIEKIRQIAAKDRAYPEKYALGVAYYRAKNPLASIEAFRDFVRARPEGPLALRAQNHLRAAVRSANEASER